MSYLIDTDILIYCLKGREIVQKRFIENEKIPKSISVVTYGELLYGAKKSTNSEKNLAVVYRIKELFPIIDVDKAVIPFSATRDIDIAPHFPRSLTKGWDRHTLPQEHREEIRLVSEWNLTRA